MPFLILDECAKSFVRYRCHGEKEKTTADHLLKKLLDHPKLEPIRSQDSFRSEDFSLAVQETVSNYKNSKDSAISILKQFAAYVTEKTNTDVSDIPWPEIPVSSTFERLMYISKYLQDPKHKIEDLYGKLWVGERTIHTDINKLRGKDTDPIQICGRKFTIEDTSKKKGRLVFKSTVHPFFLTFNLTQVIVILEGLRVKAEDPFLSGYAIHAACDIWEQLSDYGKDRIRIVLSELMPTDLSWYDKLNQMQYSNRGRFASEELCSRTEGHYAMLECMKNGFPVFMEYEGEAGREFIEGALVLQWTKEGFLISENGNERTLDPDRILRSATRKEMLL